VQSSVQNIHQPIQFLYNTQDNVSKIYSSAKMSTSQQLDTQSSYLNIHPLNSSQTKGRNILYFTFLNKNSANIPNCLQAIQVCSQKILQSLIHSSIVVFQFSRRHESLHYIIRNFCSAFLVSSNYRLKYIYQFFF